MPEPDESASAPSGPADGTAPSADAVKRSAHTWLGRPLWQGVGAIIGLGSLIVTLAIACDERANRPPAAGSGSSAPQVQQQINGNCNGQGVDIEINCAASPISRAEVAFYYPYLGGAVFAGPPAELSTPPEIPAASGRSHCEEWAEWMDNNPRIYRPLAFTLGMSAGQQDLVVLRGVSVKIFKRTPMVATIAIGCGYGGDGVWEGYTVTVDTVRSETILQKGDAGGGHQMPPAAVSLGEPGYLAVDIAGKSAPGFLYEGQVVIDAIVNGENRSIVKGTTDRPFRWYGATARRNPGFYDWDFKSRKLSFFADDFEYLDQIPE
jgi:hypothetical protein